MNYDEAVQAATAPGQIYEIEDGVVRGLPMKVFTNAPSSLADMFGLAAFHGDVDFLVYGEERMTFTTMYEQVRSLAGGLVKELHVTPGMRVALAMRNLPEWVVSYGAICHAGAIIVPLNAWWTAEELAFAIRDAGVSVVIADPERLERLYGQREELGITLVGARTEPREGVVPFESLLGATPIDKVEVQPDDDATILYTSGTTGRPKGAVSSHRAVVSAIMAYGTRNTVATLLAPPTTEPTERVAFILVVPLFHVTGCIPVMLGALVTGAKLVLMHHWDPEQALEVIERERITHFIGVPTMSWDLLESPRFMTADTSTLRSVGGGGAPVPTALVDRLHRSLGTGRAGFGYGMTETNAYGPQIFGADLEAHPTSAGKTLPIMSVRVVDSLGNVLGPHEIGEISFYGVNLADRYWNLPEATASSFPGGWLRSGDLGYLDEEGYVYVVDRAKDMVIRGGENIYCIEVEAALYEHPAVYEAAVFGVPHERLGEELVAVIYLREGHHVTEEELQSFLSTRLAKFKIPSRIHFVEEALPRGATGKILKRAIREGLLG